MTLLKKTDKAMIWEHNIDQQYITKMKIILKTY